MNWKNFINDAGHPKTTDPGFLKALGHNAPKPSVSDYLDWFEDASFFFGVRIFDASLVRNQTNPKKAYCVDPAWRFLLDRSAEEELP